MAKIPRLTERPINTEVSRLPGPTGEGARRIGRAGAKIGQTVTDFGVQLMKKRAMAESDSQTNLALGEFKRFSADVKRELDSEFAGTDHAGYSKRYQELVKEKQTALMESTTNGNARQRLQLRFDSSLVDQQIAADSLENAKRSQYYRTADIEERDKNIGHLFDNPDLDQTVDLMAKDLTSLETSEYYSDAEKTKMRAHSGDYVKSTLNGMLAAGGKHIGNGLAFLKGATAKNADGSVSGHGTLLETLDPKERKGFIDKFKRMEKMQVVDAINTSVTESRNLATIAKFEFEQNGSVSAKTMRQMEDVSRSLSGVKNAPGELGQKVKLAQNAMVNAVELVKFKQDLIGKNVAEILKVKPSDGVVVDEEIGLKANDLQTISMRTKALEAMKQIVVHDSGAYAKMFNKNLEEGSEDFLETQRFLGVQNPRYFTNKRAQVEIDGLKHAIDKREALASFTNRLGKNATKALYELASKDKSLNDYALASEMTSETGRRMMVDLNTTEINNAFKDNFKDVNLMPDIIEQTMDYANAVGLENSERVNLLRNKMEAQAQLYYSQNKNAEESVKMAWQNTLGRDVQIASMDGSNVLLKRLDDSHNNSIQKQYTEAFIKTYMEPTNKNSFIHEIPFDPRAGMFTDAQGKLITRHDQFYDEIMRPEREPRFQTSKDGDGMIFTYLSDDDSRVSLKHVVKDQDGNDVLKQTVIHIENDILSDNGSYQQAAMEATKFSLDKTLAKFFSGTTPISPSLRTFSEGR